MRPLVLIFQLDKIPCPIYREFVVVPPNGEYTMLCVYISVDINVVDLITHL